MNITNADEEQTLGCIHGKESLLISPIIYWTEKDVWAFLHTVVRVPHCSLYDEGWHRIGCIGCPMSSHKQKMLENERYPHVKRNWIKAIKAIRNGGVFKREYIWWNIRKDWMPLRNVRGLLRTQAATSNIPPQHWMGERTEGYVSSRKPVFSSSSSSDRLTEEQENEIAENIYDWWISGKSYKQWYAEKFQQLKLDFGEF